MSNAGVLELERDAQHLADGVAQIDVHADDRLVVRRSRTRSARRTRRWRRSPCRPRSTSTAPWRPGRVLGRGGDGGRRAQPPVVPVVLVLVACCCCRLRWPPSGTRRRRPRPPSAVGRDPERRFVACWLMDPLRVVHDPIDRDPDPITRNPSVRGWRLVTISRNELDAPRMGPGRASERLAAVESSPCGLPWPYASCSSRSCWLAAAAAVRPAARCSTRSPAVRPWRSRWCWCSTRCGASPGSCRCCTPTAPRRRAATSGTSSRRCTCRAS